MKRIVFSILMANIFVSLWAIKAKATPHQDPKGDTVIVKLKNKNKVIIITEKSKDLSSFKTIDINQIIADIDSTFRSDSSNSEGKEMVINLNRKDSTLKIRKRTRLAGSKNIYRAVIEITDENSDTTYRDVKKYNGYRFNGHSGRSNDNELFEIDLGWNNYLENGSLPSDNNKAYGLRPFNSNVINLRYMTKFIGRNKDQRFSATAGIEASLINYKFDNSYIIRKGSESVSFDPFPSDQKMIKSKLAVTWLNLPVMLHYRAKKSSFHLAAGGYAGYRLGSHNKIKYEKDGADHKDKQYGNFYLNSLQYGARVQVGFYDVDFFATYNFNELFASNRGPALTPITFGFTIML